MLVSDSKVPCSKFMAIHVLLKQSRKKVCVSITSIAVALDCIAAFACLSFSGCKFLVS